MVISAFPPIETATPQGLLAVGGDLCVESLILAYSQGIFPWPLHSGELAWFSPPRRTILHFNNFHISKSLKKVLNSNRFTCSFDQRFSEVINACSNSSNRKDQLGTWIIPEMVEGYCNFHKAGFAHSVETYLDGKLVGGLYGVRLRNYFCGESMFYHEPNASKVALNFLIQNLKQEGLEWLDCQMMTPHFKRFGAEEITRKKFMELLGKAIR